jgi:DNA repair photolyase
MLVDAGIDVGVGIAPVLPGLTDTPERLEAVARAARDAGATGLWCNVLFLSSGTREHFLESLARHWPELLPRYERLYTGAYLPPSETDPIKRRVAALRAQVGIADRRTVKLEPPPAPEQLSLVP